MGLLRALASPRLGTALAVTLLLALVAAALLPGPHGLLGPLLLRAPVPVPWAAPLLLLAALHLLARLPALARGRWREAGRCAAALGAALLAVSLVLSRALRVETQVELAPVEEAAAADAPSRADDAERLEGWELVLVEHLVPEGVREHLVDAEHLAGAATATLRVAAPHLGCDLEVSGWLPSARAEPGTGPGSVDGVRLVADPDGRGGPGASVRVLPRAPGAAAATGLLLAGQAEPWAVRVPAEGGASRRLDLDLRRPRRALPFTVELRALAAPLWPGTETPRALEAEVVLEQHGVRTAERVALGRPLVRGSDALHLVAWRPRRSLEGGGLAPPRAGLALVSDPGAGLRALAAWLLAGGLLLHGLRRLAPTTRRPGTEVA